MSTFALPIPTSLVSGDMGCLMHLGALHGKEGGRSGPCILRRSSATLSAGRKMKTQPIDQRGGCGAE